MSTHLSLLLAACSAVTGSASEGPGPGRERRPSNWNANFHLKCITGLSFADAVEFIHLKRNAVQPYTREDCERLLMILLRNKAVEFAPRGKDLKNAQIDKDSLQKYMDEDGFGALVLLQMQEANPYAALRPESPQGSQ